MPYQAFVISHAHWDREWYQPFQEFRIRLVTMVDKLLDILARDPNYRHFMLDGQSIVVEDYLQIRPEREPDIRHLVSAGRLLIGPWYVLPDEFLVSPEALIRNLMLGQRVSHRFGEPMPVGYVPDSFGHISQLPQILAGFGIRDAAIWRGVPDLPTEFLWQSPDGTTVLNLYIRDGYGNLAWTPHDPVGFAQIVRQAVDRLAPHATTHAVLLMNGMDHVEPSPDLPGLMAAAEEHLPDLKLVHGTLPQYVAAVRAANPELPIVQSEFRCSQRSNIIPGVLSARMWIKQRNRACETLLEGWAEPFNAFAELVDWETGKLVDWESSTNSPIHQSTSLPIYQSTKTGTATLADRANDDYLLLPFEVPPGISRLTVRYTYTHRVSAALPGGSGNVVDIGVFDPRGAAVFQGHGFRGWSGSDRSEFTIGLADATPGYLPGPIYPGTWHIILGLYHIVPEGCHYRVEIAFSEEQGSKGAEEQGSKGAGEQGRRGVVSCGLKWYRGDLQSHTHHSDGTGSLADLAAAARAQGLDFVAVTEHNTVSHWAHLAAVGGDDLLLIPGQEITTYYGHTNAWGAHSWQEFRCRDDATMARIIDAVHAAGGLFSVNHPKDNGPAWEYSSDLPFDCVEAWQGLWAANNHQSLDFWDSLLRQGRRVVAVGGSDKHVKPFTGETSLYDLGTPTTWVYADELSTAGILAGIRAGHVFISADPQGPELYLTADADGDELYEAMMGDEVIVAAGQPVMLRAQAVGGKGLVLRIVSGEEVESVPVESDDFIYQWQAWPNGATFYRLELAEPTSALVRRALSNPIYVTSHAEGDG